MNRKICLLLSGFVMTFVAVAEAQQPGKASSGDDTATIVIAVASTFIALCALGISVWTGFLTRQHNRLSVMPKLEIYKNFDDEWSGLYISNLGFGPAKLVEFKIWVDNESVSGWDEAADRLGIQPEPQIFRRISAQATRYIRRRTTFL